MLVDAQSEGTPKFISFKDRWKQAATSVPSHFENSEPLAGGSSSSWTQSMTWFLLPALKRLQKCFQCVAMSGRSATLVISRQECAQLAAEMLTWRCFFPGENRSQSRIRDSGRRE